MQLWCLWCSCCYLLGSFCKLDLHVLAKVMKKGTTIARNHASINIAVQALSYFQLDQVKGSGKGGGAWVGVGPRQGGDLQRKQMKCP